MRGTLFLLLLLGRGLAYAQGDVQVWSAREGTAATPETTEPIAETSGTSTTDPAEASALDAESDTAQIQAARAKLAANPTLQLGQQIDADLLELQNAVKGGASTVDILKSEKLRGALGKMWESNPMKGLDEAKLKAMLRENNSPLAPILKAYPGGEKFLVALMQSPDAVPHLLKIFDRGDAFKLWLGLALGLMIVVWAIKRKVVQEKWPWWKKFVVRTSFGLGSMACLSLSLLAMFSDELGPTVAIALKTLL